MKLLQLGTVQDPDLILWFIYYWISRVDCKFRVDEVFKNCESNFDRKASHAYLSSHLVWHKFLFLSTGGNLKSVIRQQKSLMKSAGKIVQRHLRAEPNHLIQDIRAIISRVGISL